MRFNGIKKDYLRVNMDLFRPPTPPIEFDTLPMTKGGERVRKRRMHGMELPVPVTIKSSQRIETLKEDMSNWFVHNEAKRLEFVDSDKYYLARYQSMELRNSNPYHAKGAIMFYLPIAYRFGQHKQIPVTTQSEIHQVTGQTETPWSIEVTFTESADKFELETDNGLYLLLNYDFISGDQLTIEYEGRKVFLNGNDLRTAVRLASNYEELRPGYVEISASHECTLSYDERFY